MHKSKLAGFIIDCKTGDLTSAAGFWSQALGMKIREFPAPESEKYIGLKDPKQGLQIEVQLVDHESRVHLDIETDDICFVAESGGERQANVAQAYDGYSGLFHQSIHLAEVIVLDSDYAIRRLKRWYCEEA